MDDGDGVVGVVFGEVEEREKGGAPRASVAEYQAQAEDSLDAMAIFDTNNTVHYANPAFGRLLGYEPEELVGLFVPNIVHPEASHAGGVARRRDPELLRARQGAGGAPLPAQR